MKRVRMHRTKHGAKDNLSVLCPFAPNTDVVIRRFRVGVRATERNGNSANSATRAREMLSDESPSGKSATMISRVIADSALTDRLI